MQNTNPFGAPRPAPSRELIKTFRQLIGMSQQSFAGLLGVSMGAVRKWETGQREPRGLYLERLLEKMDEYDRAQVQRKAPGNHDAAAGSLA